MKEALRRDWEQTKADFTNNKGQELNQDVDDTVQQALGRGSAVGCKCRSGASC
ncbi:hypothetical protein WMF27_10850 [Sorangium sp. So ce281]|uniref:hypothetical protein n=1 Tax=Sorangium TaxID=39643 RepID=UPI0003078684|nr:hypothetical protein [Sorangium cellulosum]